MGARQGSHGDAITDGSQRSRQCHQRKHCETAVQHKLRKSEQGKQVDPHQDDCNKLQIAHQQVYQHLAEEQGRQAAGHGQQPGLTAVFPFTDHRACKGNDDEKHGKQGIGWHIVLGGIRNGGAVVPCHIFLPVKHHLVGHPVHVRHGNHHTAVDFKGQLIENDL